MQKTRIGKVELGGIPVIAAVIDRPVDLGALPDIRAKGAALAELRFDLMGLAANDALAYALKVKETGLFSVIGTYRETPGNQAGRLDFFRTILPAVDAIDLETGPEINETVIKLATGKIVIVSHHDFGQTPPDDQLQFLINQCLIQGSHIAKIAVTPRTNKDLDRFEAFIKKQKAPLIAITMGALGRDWRVRAFKSGSLLSYAFIGEKEVAPGQMSLDELSKKLSVAFPSFKTELNRKQV